MVSFTPIFFAPGKVPSTQWIETWVGPYWEENPSQSARGYFHHRVTYLMALNVADVKQLHVWEPRVGVA